MEYDAFLKRVIDDGIAAASESYKNEPNKKKGAVEGFEACRDKSPQQLLDLLIEANRISGEEYFKEDLDRYWELRCFALEIEWVCNCVSAALVNVGADPIIPPTMRGVIKAGDILGVKDMSKGGLFHFPKKSKDESH